MQEQWQSTAKTELKTNNTKRKKKTINTKETNMDFELFIRYDLDSVLNVEAIRNRMLRMLFKCTALYAKAYNWLTLTKLIELIAHTASVCARAWEREMEINWASTPVRIGRLWPMCGHRIAWYLVRTRHPTLDYSTASGIHYIPRPETVFRSWSI